MLHKKIRLQRCGAFLYTFCGFFFPRGKSCVWSWQSWSRGEPKFVAGGIATMMNTCYLASDPFIDVTNTRSHLEGDEWWYEATLEISVIPSWSFLPFFLTSWKLYLPNTSAVLGRVRKSPPAAWCVAGVLLALMLKANPQTSKELGLVPPQTKGRAAAKDMPRIWPQEHKAKRAAAGTGL